jgi:predicted nucleic acid-binding protein
VVDTSVWIDFFSGFEVPALEEALATGSVVLPPVVVAELISGAQDAKSRDLLRELLLDLEVHPTPVDHWLRVGELRRTLLSKGISISTPDAHVAQCALDRSAGLLGRDKVFRDVARHFPLRLVAGWPARRRT